MNGTILAVLLSLAVAMAVDVVNVNLDDQKHNQQGEAGTAVTGSYSFVDADGVTHTTTYIADDKGYRVIGRSSSGGIAAPAAVRAPAPKPVPVPAPAPVPVPVPAPKPVPAPVPVPKPVVVSAPAPAAVRLVAPAPAPVPVAAPAPVVQDANGGLVYYVVSGGNFPFGAQFGSPVAAPVAAPVPTGALRTTEIKTSAVQSPAYYIVSSNGLTSGSVPVSGAKAVSGQQVFTLPAGAQQIPISGFPFNLPVSGARAVSGQQVFTLPAGAQQIPVSGFPFNVPLSVANTKA